VLSRSDVRIDFHVGGHRAELELTLWGERRLFVGARLMYRAKIWQRARWLVAADGHAATLVSRFWPWPYHRLLVDGVPDPRVRSLSFASRAPVWLVLFYLLFGLGVTPARMVGLIHVFQLGVEMGAAAYISAGADDAPTIWPREPNKAMVTCLGRFKWIFGDRREALLAAAMVYAGNQQPDDAQRLVFQAVQRPAPPLTPHLTNARRIVLFSLAWTNACDGMAALVAAEPDAFIGMDTEHLIAWCRREPINLRSQPELSADQDSNFVGRAKAAWWNGELDIAVDLVRRAQVCPLCSADELPPLRMALAARAGNRDEELRALDAQLCQRKCSEHFLRVNRMTSALLDDPEILDRVHSACTRPELPAYDSL